jgi:excisionase family DNA binding protein
MSGPRFLTLDEVAEELATSRAQVYALIRRGDLIAIKLGVRGQWRVERAKLEDYIERLYAETRQWVAEHPWAGAEEDPGESS